MSEKELELLECLEQNSRYEVNTLSKMLDITEDEIKEMMKRLEQEHIIVRYTTLINWGALRKEEKLTAMIDVKVTPKKDIGFDGIAEKIYRYPEVTSVYLMSGTYDLSIVVEGKTMGDIASFVSQKLSTLDTVLSTTTHFILKKYKHDGIILEQDSDDHRIVVSP